MKFKIDSRDIHFHRKFGQTVKDYTPFTFDTPLADIVQSIGNVQCTCITACDIAADQDGTIYDVDELWTRVPHDNDGAEPRKVLSEVIKNGLKTKSGQLIKNWTSYWVAHTGNYDPFDNVISTLRLAQSPVAIWSPWYSNWTSDILPVGESTTNYHMYVIEGLDIRNMQPHLVIEAHVGRKLYMSREVFNKTISTWGSSTAVLSNSSIDARREKSILEAIRDTIINVWLAVVRIKLSLIQKQVEELPKNDVKEAYEEVKESIKMTPSQKLYDIAYSLLGKYLTLNSAVPKNLNCAQALSYVLKQAGYVVPKKGISHTTQMYEWLKQNCDEVFAPEVGNIIISVTVGNNHGHAGIVGKNSIMSNDSSTGLWKAYWNVKTWIDYYSVQKKLKTHYFRVR